MKIMIVNDPSRKNDDPTYLLDRLGYLSTLMDESVRVMAIYGYDDVAIIVDEIYGEDEGFRYTSVSEDFRCFKEYAQTCDYLLIMPDALQEGITGALIRAFTRYNDINNIFTF